MKIVPVSHTCALTFTMQYLKIKEETSLFEWFQSNQLQYITDVINKIKIKIDDNIILNTNRKNMICMNTAGIFSGHYTVESYKKIFIRRANRFLYKIKNSEELLFVRLNSHDGTPTSLVELKNFYKSILSINPSLKIKFLLIDVVTLEKDFREIKDEYLTHKFILNIDIGGDRYLKNNKKVSELILKYVNEIGYKTYIVNKEFGDYSIN